MASQGEFLLELRRYLLDSSTKELPRPGSNEPVGVQETLSWGWPATRIDAAVGLCILMYSAASADEEVLSAIERLATGDPCSMVRLQVMGRLGALWKHSRERFERIAMHVVHSDASGAVVSKFVKQGLNYIAHEDVNRAIELLGVILTRFPGDIPETDGQGQPYSIWYQAVNCYVCACVYHQHLDACEQLSNIIREPWRVEAQWITEFLSSFLTDGPSSANSSSEAARQRAWDLLRRLVTSARQAFQTLSAANPTADSEPGKQFLSVQHTLKAVADLLCHKTDAYEVQKKRHGEGGNPSPRAAREAVFREAQSIAGDLASIGVPAISDKVLKALGGVVDFAPREALLLASKAVDSASARGIANDSFALHRVYS